MKVSVIIPVYNAENHLPACLDSLLSQTLTDIEIICINDSSTDHSLVILDRYTRNDKRLIVRNQKPAGAGAARNKGMEFANGDYFSFLDADDFFEPTLLEKMYLRAREKDADVAICRAKCYDNQTKQFSPMPWSLRSEYLPEKDPFSYKEMPEHIFNTFQNWTWNKLFKKSLIFQNKLSFQQTRRTTDLLFTCLALVTAERITTSQDALINYRKGHVTSNQATNDFAFSDFYTAFCALKQCLTEHGISVEVEQSYVNWALSGCLSNLTSLKTGYARKMLYGNLRKDYFSHLNIDKHPKHYFYNPAEYSRYEVIKNNSYFRYKCNRRIGLLLSRLRTIASGVKSLSDRF